MSKEAKDGSKLCAQRIKELFEENWNFFYFTVVFIMMFLNITVKAL